MRDLLTIDEARARILEHAQVLPPEAVAPEAAAGRVLAEPAISATDLPPFPSSAMDGFAVRAGETPGTLPVVLRVAAGHPAPGPLPPGTTASIATGGAVPDGADAVVPVERVVERDGLVEFREAAEQGMHIRLPGSDARSGEVVVHAGTRLGPAHVGALGATGIARVRVARRPRVAVLATGSELRTPGESLGPGEIFESNRSLIGAALTAVGAEIELLPIVGDDDRAHREALRAGLVADILVTSGGVSVGPHDLVRRLADEIGIEKVFWGVAVKPGKPLFFGTRDRTLVFGLPGNPVSALVGTLVFVGPAVLRLQGAAEIGPAYEVGRAGARLERDAQRDQFIRARRRDEIEGTVLDAIVGQESHMIVRTAAANALVHVPRGTGAVAQNDFVHYIVLA